MQHKLGTVRVTRIDGEQRYATLTTDGWYVLPPGTVAAVNNQLDTGGRISMLSVFGLRMSLVHVLADKVWYSLDTDVCPMLFDDARAAVVAIVLSGKADAKLLEKWDGTTSYLPEAP